MSGWKKTGSETLSGKRQAMATFEPADFERIDALAKARDLPVTRVVSELAVRGLRGMEAAMRNKRRARQRASSEDEGAGARSEQQT